MSLSDFTATSSSSSEVIVAVALFMTSSEGDWKQRQREKRDWDQLKKNIQSNPVPESNIRPTPPPPRLILLTAIGLISSGARIGKLHAVLVNTPADADRTVTLRRLVEPLAVAVGRIRAQ